VFACSCPPIMHEIYEYRDYREGVHMRTDTDYHSQTERTTVDVGADRPKRSLLRKVWEAIW
ncbi:hypothetical protein ACFL2T_00215, partial [Elusimicrobiota bacterium]